MPKKDGAYRLSLSDIDFHAYILNSLHLRLSSLGISMGRVFHAYKDPIYLPNRQMQVFPDILVLLKSNIKGSRPTEGIPIELKVRNCSNRDYDYAHFQLYNGAEFLKNIWNVDVSHGLLVRTYNGERFELEKIAYDTLIKTCRGKNPHKK